MARIGFAVVLALGLAACQGTGRLVGDGPSSRPVETAWVRTGDVIAMPDDEPPAGAGDTAPTAAPTHVVLVADDEPPPPAEAPPAPSGEAAPPAAPPPDDVVIVRTAPTVQDVDRACRRACDPCPKPCGPCAGRCGKPCGGRCGGGNRCGPRGGYLGASFQAFPGLGFGVEGGTWFAQTSRVRWAAELSASYQDQTDQFNDIKEGDGGKWSSARVGVKASFNPCSCSHPVLRGGIAWWNSEQNVRSMDVGDLTGTDDWFGLYVGAGWEWDLLGGRVTTGPGVDLFGGWALGAGEFGWTPTISWHVLLNL